MAKKKITEIAEELLKDFLEENGYELYHSEFVKEGSDWFLRVYIDWKQGGEEERYISTDDCEKVSRYLSEKLDQEDPIKQNYYLMVSSPGMDRPLVKPEHWERYVGHDVEIRLYRGKDGKKNITGTLDSYEPAAAGDEQGGAGASADARVTITDETGKQWQLELSEIARAKLAVIF